jgi:hypothetical protein
MSGFEDRGAFKIKSDVTDGRSNYFTNASTSYRTIESMNHESYIYN